jgi:hypothetical protein
MGEASGDIPREAQGAAYANRRYEALRCPLGICPQNDRYRSRTPPGWDMCSNVGEPIYVSDCKRQGFIPFKARSARNRPR